MRQDLVALAFLGSLFCGCAATYRAAPPPPTEAVFASFVRPLSSPRFNVAAKKPPVFNILYSFPGGGDGWLPKSDLLSDSAGNLYGTTYYGGSTNCQNGCGVVYEIDTSGHESIVHTFAGPPSDGANPDTGLIADKAGNLYGATSSGGTTDTGTVYKIDTSGHESVIYSFCPAYPNCSDGKGPASNLVMDSAGNLYGTTYIGGITSGPCGGTYYGCGVVFKISGGKESVIYSFKGSPNDGKAPVGDLMLHGTLIYGTTVNGGIASASPCGGSVYGCGTVFQVTTNGKRKILHRFTGGSSDGAFPNGGVIRDSAGTLYGTAQNGGPSNSGVVYEIKSGKESVLYAFTGQAPSSTDGYSPIGRLVQDKAGNLYGVTVVGGAAGGYGTVFEVKPNGVETILHSFGGAANGDGSEPAAGLLGVGKTLYGTTEDGGSSNEGIVFSI